MNHKPIISQRYKPPGRGGQLCALFMVINSFHFPGALLLFVYISSSSQSSTGSVSSFSFISKQKVNNEDTFPVEDWEELLKETTEALRENEKNQKSGCVRKKPNSVKKTVF